MVVWGWGLRLGFWGRGSQLMGFGAYGVVWCSVGFLGWDSLCKHKRITLGKNGAATAAVAVLFSKS